MPPGVPEAAVHVVGNVVSHPANGGSLSSWLTFATIASAIIVAYFGFLPKLKAVTNKRLDTLDDERRGDMAVMRDEIKELRGLVTNAVDKANAAETRSAILRAVVSMLTAEVQRMEPNNPVLKQAQTMIRDASAGDLGMGRGLQDIAVKVAGLE